MAFVKARLILDQSPPGTLLYFLWDQHPSNDTLHQSIASLDHIIRPATVTDSQSLSFTDQEFLSRTVAGTVSGLIHALVKVKNNK